MRRAHRNRLLAFSLIAALGCWRRGETYAQESDPQNESGAEAPSTAGDTEDEAGEPEGASTPDPDESGPTKADEPSVFEDLSRDPYDYRNGRLPDEGWIPLFKTRTELKFSGFIQLNVIHDFQNAGFPHGWFVPGLIPAPTDKTPNTEFDPRPSRFVFETKTATEKAGDVSTLLSFDFFGDLSSSTARVFPTPRLYQAYVAWVGPKSQVAFTVGQAWSSFLDLRVWPMILDLQGPNAMSGARQGLLQASYAFGKDKSVVFAGSIEQPDTAVQDPASATGVGTGIRRAPDIAARLTWSGDWGHLQAAMLLWVLSAQSTTSGNRDSAFGNGGSLSGRFNIRRTLRDVGAPDNLGPRQDLIQYQVHGGCGTGRYIFDLSTTTLPQDAVWDDASGELLPLCQVGGFVGYHHWWTDDLHTQVVGSLEQVFNRGVQADETYKRGLYVLGNLGYRFFFRMDIGVEYYFGKRWEKNDASGYAHRLMFAANYGW